MTNTASFFPYQLLWGLAAASPSALTLHSLTRYAVEMNSFTGPRGQASNISSASPSPLSSPWDWRSHLLALHHTLTWESLAASFTFCLNHWRFLGVNNTAAHTLISPVFLKHHYMSFKHFPFALTAALIGSRGFHSFSDFWHCFFIKLNHGEKYQISIWLMVRKHESYPLTRAHRGLSCHQLTWFQYCVTGNRGVRGERKTGDGLVTGTLRTHSISQCCVLDVICVVHRLPGQWQLKHHRSQKK